MITANEARLKTILPEVVFERNVNNSLEEIERNILWSASHGRRNANYKRSSDISFLSELQKRLDALGYRTSIDHPTSDSIVNLTLNVEW